MNPECPVSVQFRPAGSCRHVMLSSPPLFTRMSNSVSVSSRLPQRCCLTVVRPLHHCCTTAAPPLHHRCTTAVSWLITNYFAIYVYYFPCSLCLARYVLSLLHPKVKISKEKYLRPDTSRKINFFQAKIKLVICGILFWKLGWFFRVLFSCGIVLYVSTISVLKTLNTTIIQELILSIEED